MPIGAWLPILIAIYLLIFLGEPEHLYQAFTEGHADGALVASITHYEEYTCRQLKEYLNKRDIKVRMNY